MKLINKLIAFAAIGTGAFLVGCQDVEISDPNITTTASDSYANFVLVNASPDATSLDLFVNNLKSGASVSTGNAQAAYEKVAITSNGVLANTSIKAKASSGTIGGVLGSNNLIFRAGNNNTNNFTAVDSAYYTIIAVDSITRPKPVRKLDENDFGDTTFVVRATGAQIGVVDWRALAPTVAERNKKADAIGIVPLGSSDPGGVRFLVITDQLPLPSTTRFPKPVAGKCAVRFIMTSPNTGTPFTGSVALTVGGTAVTQGITSNQLSFASWTPAPSVGSRSVTNNAYNTTINANDASPVAHNIVVMQGATELARIDNYEFDEKGVYTIVLSGNRRTLPMSLTIIKNK
jgi:hypothetical protein